MKTLIPLLLLLPFICFGQVPQSMNYQAMALDDNGFEIAQTQISIQVSIIEESPSGLITFVEEHAVTTDAFGMFSINIGQGNSEDDYTSVDWSKLNFLRVELDEDMDGIYTLMGVSAFNSVPYSYMAENVMNPEDLMDNLGNHNATQTLDMDSNYVSQVLAPELPLDAANKQYVDDMIGDITSEIDSLKNIVDIVSSYIGCKDYNACNYSVIAIMSDSSCHYPQIGFLCNGVCLDSDEDSICDVDELSGCTDELSCNFVPLAEIDDGFCNFPSLGYDCFGNITEYFNGMEADGGIVFYYDSVGGKGLVVSDIIGLSPWGCYGQNIESTNSPSFDVSYQNTLNIADQCEEINSAATISLSFEYQEYSDWFLPSISLLEMIHQSIGLLDDNYWSSTQYDSDNAYVFDGNDESYFFKEKWSSNSVIAVRAFGNWIEGCIDSTAYNFSIDVTLPNSFTCVPIIYGCVDTSALNYSIQSNTDDGTCCYVVGCTDESSTNFNPIACIDDGSCGIDFLSTYQTHISSGSYRNFKVYESDLIYINPGETITLFIEDTCIISGIINGDGGLSSDQCNENSYSNPCPSLGSSALSSGGSSGGGYSSTSSCNVTPESGHGNINSQNIHGGKGGTSFYWQSGNIKCGYGGGEGGSGLRIFADVLIFDGEIHVKGGEGSNCAQSQYGVWATGGGGGGSVFINANEILNQSGSVINNGGSGGACSNTNPYSMTPASNGENGTFLIE